MSLVGLTYLIKLYLNTYANIELCIIFNYVFIVMNELQKEQIAMRFELKWNVSRNGLKCYGSGIRHPLQKNYEEEYTRVYQTLCEARFGAGCLIYQLFGRNRVENTW